MYRLSYATRRFYNRTRVLPKQAPYEDGKMNSRLFSRFDPETDENRELKKGLRSLLGLSASARDACIRQLPDFLLAVTLEQSKRIVKDLEDEENVSGLESTSAFRIGRFFLQAMERESTREDSAQAWADDLIELDFLSRPESASFVEIVERIRGDILPSVGPELRQREYATGVLPSLRSCGVTAELRGVVEDNFHWGNPVDEYHPKLLGVVPVASIHIGVDAGPQTDFYFQASKSDLQLLIDSLVAARIDLESLESCVQFRSQ